MKTFVIATDSRINEGETLFLKHREENDPYFWTNRESGAYHYRNKKAAENRAASMKHGSPRVIPASEARRIDQRNMNRREGIDVLHDLVGEDGRGYVSLQLSA